MQTSPLLHAHAGKERGSGKSTLQICLACAQSTISTLYATRGPAAPQANIVARMPNEASRQPNNTKTMGRMPARDLTSSTRIGKRQVQKSDRINSDRQSGSDQLGSTRTNSDRMKK